MHSTPNAPSSSSRHRTPLVAQLSLATLVAAMALAGCASAPASESLPDRLAKPQPTALAPAANSAQVSAPVGTAAEVPPEEGFDAWRTAFSKQALAAGIAPQTVREVLASAQWQPRVVELDRAQPEFTRTPWAYLDSAVSPQRVAQGREQRRIHAAALEAAEQRLLGG